MENQQINEVKEAISNAEKKEFSKFADKVKTSLEDKLRNNPTIKAKGDELKSLQKMKDTFAKIEGTKSAKQETPDVSQEPTEPTEPTEPQE